MTQYPASPAPLAHDASPEAIEVHEESSATPADTVASEEPGSAEPVVAESASDEPVAEEPASDEPVSEEPVSEEPASDVPVSEQPVAVGPESDRPSPVPAARPAVPSPAALAKRLGPNPATAYGRVDETGQVYVKTADGERAVGSYPGASPQTALAHFARKYDELAAQVALVEQRADSADVPAKELTDQVAKLRGQVEGASVVGDLAALEARLTAVGARVEERRETERVARQQARAEATAAREALVAEAEKLASQPPERIHWKNSAPRMRELLDQWKEAQRSGPRLDRDVEQGLWARLSAARNSFDRARRTHFAQLDATQGEAKAAKANLVAEAERLATSKDWVATAGEFKRLMDRWRQAGRAGRAEDDALWERFHAAQETFFNAKDALVAAEQEEFRANLVVKEALLVEAEALLPVKDIEASKAALRVIQDKWDKAGKVPRADMERIEKAMRRVEQTVRDADDRKWAATNPEVAARASSLVVQLEKAIADLEADLAKATASGNARKIKDAQEALSARQQWLEQARAGLAEFGG